MRTTQHLLRRDDEVVVDIERIGRLVSPDEGRPGRPRSRWCAPGRLARPEERAEPEGFILPDSWSVAPGACDLRNRKELHAVLAAVLPGSRVSSEPEGVDQMRGTASCWCSGTSSRSCSGRGRALDATVSIGSGWRRRARGCREAAGPRRAAGDPAAVAPGARQEEVDLSEDGSTRPAADRAWRAGPHRPPGPGEPPLGIPADPWGAPQARDQDLCDDGPDDPAPPRARPSSSPGKPDVDPVPPITGGGDPCDRLLHRRDDQPQDPLRPVLHRARDTARAPERCRGTS